MVDTRAALASLRQEIDADNPRRLAHAECISDWDGADIVVTTRRNMGREPLLTDGRFVVVQTHEFEPAGRHIVTRHASALAWLLCRLRDTIGASPDGAALQFDLFDRLASVAVRFLEENGDWAGEEGLLDAVLAEAETLVSGECVGEAAA